MEGKSEKEKLTGDRISNPNLKDINGMEAISSAYASSRNIGGFYLDRGHAEYTGKKEPESRANTLAQEKRHDLLKKLIGSSLSGVARIKLHSSGEIVFYLKRGIHYNEAELGLIVSHATNHTATVEHRAGSNGFIIKKTKDEIEVPKTDITEIIKRMDAAVKARER